MFAPRMHLTHYPELKHGAWFAFVCSGRVEGVAFSNEPAVALLAAWHDWMRKIQAEARA